jgi:heme-degrading monooxygenase HmoA
MKAFFLTGMCTLCLYMGQLTAQTSYSNMPVKNHHSDTMQQIFIDKFIVPEAARTAFMERAKINRGFIKSLPGFIQDAAYERTDEQGNLVIITMAVWQNEAALVKAREAVFAEYKRQGFDPAAFFKQMNIIADRGVYTEAVH